MKIFDNMLEVERFVLLDTPYATFIACYFHGSHKSSTNNGLQDHLGLWEQVFAEDSFTGGIFAVYRRSHPLNAKPYLP